MDGSAKQALVAIAERHLARAAEFEAVLAGHDFDPVDRGDWERWASDHRWAAEKVVDIAMGKPVIIDRT